MSVEGNSDSTTAQFWFSSDDKFRFGIETADIFVTNAVFRDCSAWYHFLLAFDATNATSADKIILYVNGVRQTTSTYTAPSNTDYGFNRSGAIHSLCRRQNNADWYFNGYVAQAQFIDGQQLTPASFAETDATTGQWIPKAFSGGSYGTNGFYLRFNDNSTTAALGTDSSGNGNTWTTNNLSVTAGAGNDSLIDSPTNYGTDTYVGGEVRGNYATWNPLTSTNSITLANGNLYTTVSSAGNVVRSTILAASGKWYFEATFTSSSPGSGGSCVGVVNDSQSIVSPTELAAVPAGMWFWRDDAYKVNNGTGTSYGTSASSNDVIMVAFDVDAGKVWFGRQGTWFVSGNPASGTNESFSGLTGSLGPCVNFQGTFGSGTFELNAGARAFAYTAPSGFKALCTQNLPAPLVTKSNTVMDVVLYTGDGGTQTVSGLAFGPDFVWTKVRNIGYGHRVWDTVRGATKRLETHDTTAEVTETTALTAFNSDGFTVGSEANVNQSGRPYVAWAWDAGTSTVANNSGSISSQVRANATAGFSVVNVPGYTYPTKTAGHGLGVEPHFIITKSRGVSNPWIIYHKSAGANTYFQFHTGAGYTGVAGVWSGVTSTVFPLNSGVNQQTDILACCFAPVVGYSSFGSYTGNGSSTDNTFVYTGMRPRFVMLKRSDSTGNWVIWDAVRNSYNVANSIILPNTSAAEYSPDAKIDILSNGFKVRDNSGDSGSSGGTYIYAAFAEAPFNYSRAR